MDMKDVELKIKKKHSGKKCHCVLIVVAVGILVSIGLLVCSCFYGNFPSIVFEHDIIIHEGNVTYLAFGKPIDSQFYDQVTFNINPLFSARGYSVSFNIHQLQCTDSSQLHRNLKHLSFTEKITRSHGIHNLLHFQNVPDYNDAVEASQYMLEDSHVSVTIEYLDLVPDIANVSLYIVSDSDTCDELLTSNDPILHSPYTSNNRLKKLTFNKERLTSSLTIKQDSYVCGVWDIPVNSTLTYNATATVFSYDINFYKNRSISSTTCIVEPYVQQKSCDVPIQRTTLQAKKRNICFLVTREDKTTSDVLVSSKVHRTLSNAGFLVPLIVLGNIILATMYTMSVVVCYLCHRSRRKLPEEYSLLHDKLKY